MGARALRKTLLPAVYNSTRPTLIADLPYNLSVDKSGGLIIGNSDRPTFSTSLFDVAPTTSTWNALTLEQPASPTKTIHIKRVVIWNPGKFTTAQTTIMSLIRSSTASSVGDGALSPVVRDASDTATATGRTGAATSITLGTTGNTAAQFSVWSPTAAATFTPVMIDLTNDNLCKGVIIPATANAGVVFRIVGATGGANVSFSVVWTEE